MSYILDALRESQQAREKQQVPGLTTVQQGAVESRDRSGRNRTLRYITGALVMAVIAAGTGWWWGATELPGDEPQETSVGTGGGKPTRRLEPEADARSSRPVPNEMSEQTAAVQSESAPVPNETLLNETQTPDGEPAPVTVASDPENSLERVPDNALDNTATALSVISESSADAAKTRENRLSRNETGEVADPPSTNSERSVSDLAPEQHETVPHFRELPYDIQKDLPAIIYSVHLYSPNPAGRMVKIDGVMRREGDEVLPDVTLLEITPNGAVFMFRDYKFRVPVH